MLRLSGLNVRANMKKAKTFRRMRPCKITNFIFGVISTYFNSLCFSSYHTLISVCLSYCHILNKHVLIILFTEKHNLFLLSLTTSSP
jgi:hypothetical protein